ncbi:MAG TPA: hypothetical protein VK806_07805 [Bacteroidia bacterium]|jgi:hypothetical protein|nr:hypothetical protein [Bacteroidia bacterium]
MDEWNNFFVAVVGAAAALTGLIFVGVSINLTRILSIPSLPNRALISLLLLMQILVMSILFLVPRQSALLLGIEVLSILIIVWVIVSMIDVKTFRDKEAKLKRRYAINILFDQAALLPYFICGILLLAGCESALYWIVPAIIFSFIKAVLDAWVLLIEINR